MTYTDDRPPPTEPPEPAWEPPEDPGPTAHTQPPAGDRTPPQDLLAEQSVLGAMISAPKVIDEISTELEPTDFYRPAHEEIYNAVLTLHATGTPVDLVTLAGHLAELPGTRHRGRTQTLLEQLGGPTYLHTLQLACPIPGNATYYATIVRDKARARAIIEAGTRITQHGYAADHDQLDTHLGDALQVLDDLVLRTGPRQHQITTWSPVDLGPVLAGEHLDPPPTMLRRTDGIPLIYEGAVHTISGESESGKTWLTLIAALQLFHDQRDVVFVDFEDRADRVVGRLLALGAHPDQIRNHFAYVRPDRPLDDGGRTQLAPALTGRALCIIDGVTEAMTMHGFDLNSNADSATFQGLLPRWVADHGPAVVMIDHVVKDKERQDRFALGAQHKLAGIDGAAYIVKMIQPFARGRRGLAKVEIAKDRPGHVREQAFGRTIAEFTLDASVSDYVLDAVLAPPGAESGRTGQPFEPTHLMEKISHYVQLNPGLSKKAIEDVVNGKAATKRLALELLVTRGYVGTKTEARGRISHFPLKPYFPPTDDASDSGHDSDTDTLEEGTA